MNQTTKEVAIHENVNMKDGEERPVRIEEVVTRYYEKPIIEERIRHVQKIVEVERRIPQCQVFEKIVEIENTTPQIIKKYVDVPIDETVIIPSKEKKIVEIHQTIEKLVPTFYHRVIEKQIKKPKIIEIEKPVIIDKCHPIPGPISRTDVPMVVSHKVLPPVVRESDQVVEIPVRRIIPKIEYVDIIIPNHSISEKEVASKIQSQVECRLISHSYRPIFDAEQLLKDGRSLPISCAKQKDDVQIEVKPNSTEDGKEKKGLCVDFQHTRADSVFTTADYNSWLLVLNESLKNPSIVGLSSAEAEKIDFLNTLPFIKASDGSIPFLPTGAPMQGIVLKPSDVNSLPSRCKQTPVGGSIDTRLYPMISQSIKKHHDYVTPFVHPVKSLPYSSCQLENRG